MSNPLNVQRINLGDLTNANNVQRLQTHLQDLYNKAIPQITGSGAPKTAPPKIGSQYLDLTNKKVYVATGNSHSSDWQAVN